MGISSLQFEDYSGKKTASLSEMDSTSLVDDTVWRADQRTSSWYCKGEMRGREMLRGRLDSGK